MTNHDDDRYTGNTAAAVSGNMPDHFDRTLADLHGLPGSLQTKPAIRRVIRPMGVGGTDMFVVQTIRLRDEQDPTDDKTAPARYMTFLEVTSRDGHVRLVLPPEVTDLIASQRDSLTDRARKVGARQAAKTRKARGIVPNFGKKVRPCAKCGRPKSEHSYGDGKTVVGVNGCVYAERKKALDK